MIPAKIKKLHDKFVMPSKSHESDACYDLTATSFDIKETESGVKYPEYGLGFAMEIPPYHCALVFPRSSISNKDMMQANGVAVIDSNYRGEWKVRYKMTGKGANYRQTYEVGDRVAQFMIIPVLDLDLQLLGDNEELSNTDRGTGGFGSTNK